MEKSKKIKILALLLIILLGFYARRVNYYVWPREGATFDEYAWPWIGINLIKEGEPASWSPHSQYKDFQMIIFRNAPFRLVKPYLEHPPLFGLISGGYALLSGAKNMYDSEHINPQNLRKLSLFFGVISILMVYLLTAKIYGEKIALLAALLFATAPSVAVGSRLLQNENFMIPVWLLVLWLLTIYLEKKNKALLYLISAISGLMLWAKIPWGVIGVSTCGILFYKKRRRDCLLIISSMVVSLGLFFVYGYFYDWEVFSNLWKLQLNRYDIGLQTVLSIFTHPYLTDRILIDGWIYFGWVSIAATLGNFKKHFFLIIPFLTYFMLYIWAIPGVQMQGWYRYPLYPFLIISIAYLLLEMFTKPTLLAIFFQFFIGSAVFINGWEPIFGITGSLFRGLILCWSVPALLYCFFGGKFKKFYQLSFTFWLAVFIMLSISAARLYNEQ